MEQFLFLDFLTTISIKFDFFMNMLEEYFSGANSLKIVSLVLMLFALILFLSLMIIIHVRNAIYFVRGNNPKKNLETEDDEEIKLFNEEEQLELEKELQKELDLALAERRASEQKAEEEQREKEKAKKIKEEQKKIKKEQEKKEEKEKTEENKKGKKNKEQIDLDWQKGRTHQEYVSKTQDDYPISLSYKQSKQDLNQLIGLVIDMLGRGVDDLKIAQTLNFKNQGMSDENDILKAIDSIKCFIELCISGRFAKLKEYNNLPKEEQALYHLANGDVSLALALLENLMDTEIDRANASNSEEKGQRLYTEISSYACCFGSLAEMSDVMLATSAYELAIELNSNNVIAWSRLGDVYKTANSTSKAVWAYQNVINFADGEIDATHVANANKHLSEYLYAEGDSIQAAKLYNSSKQYYDSLGINRRLDKQEIEVIEIIDSNSQKSLPEMIQRLLGSAQNNN